MKKIGLLLLAACFLLPVQAKAADGQIGLYVAPKFIYGIETFKMKGEEEGESFGLGNHNKSVFGGALAIGYDFSKQLDLPIRTELEYSVLSQAEGKKTVSGESASQAYKSKIDIQSLFVNVYYDFHNESKFTPYIGGGIGLGFVGMKTSATDTEYAGDVSNYSMGKKNETNFAWNLGLGCAYELTESFSIDAGYRYADFGKGKTKAYTESDGWYAKSKTDRIGMHQFMLAARYTF